MKKIIFSLTLLSTAILTSCKFDQKPVGTYTGTFSANTWYSPYFPVSSGNGTLVVTESSKDHYDLLFTSAGNPDLISTNTPGGRTSVLFGTFFDIGVGEYPVYTTVYIDASDWSVSYKFKYNEAELEFQGTKQP